MITRDHAKARALADQAAAGTTTESYSAAPAGDIVMRNGDWVVRLGASP